MNQKAFDPISDERSSERMNAIIRIATNKSKSDPTFEPIILELTNKAQQEKRFSGAHVFVFDESEEVYGGRTRLMWTVRIEDRFTDFIEHDDYQNLMLAIPATNHNVDLLVSHHAGGEWTIHNDKYARLVEDRAKTLIHERDAAKELEQPQFDSGIQSTEDKLRMQLAEMQRQLEAARVSPVVATPQVQPVEIPSSPPQPARNVYSKEAKQAVMEKHKEEIDEMINKEGKTKYWLDKRYRKWLKDEQSKVEAGAVVT